MVDALRHPTTFTVISAKLGQQPTGVGHGMRRVWAGLPALKCGNANPWHSGRDGGLMRSVTMVNESGDASSGRIAKQCSIAMICRCGMRSIG